MKSLTFELGLLAFQCYFSLIKFWSLVCSEAMKILVLHLKVFLFKLTETYCCFVQAKSLMEMK